MPAPETTLPALKNFKMRQNLWKSEKFDLLTKSAIQTIFFFQGLILRRIEKKFSDHNFQENVSISEDASRVSMAEAMPASAKYPGYITAGVHTESMENSTQ